MWILTISTRKDRATIAKKLWCISVNLFPFFQISGTLSMDYLLPCSHNFKLPSTLWGVKTFGSLISSSWREKVTLPLGFLLSIFTATGARYLQYYTDFRLCTNTNSTHSFLRVVTVLDSFDLLNLSKGHWEYYVFMLYSSVLWTVRAL